MYNYTGHFTSKFTLTAHIKLNEVNNVNHDSSGSVVKATLIEVSGSKAGKFLKYLCTFLPHSDCSIIVSKHLYSC